jgi:hypothetical protein
VQEEHGSTDMDRVIPPYAVPEESEKVIDGIKKEETR